MPLATVFTLVEAGSFPSSKFQRETKPENNSGRMTETIS